MIRGVKFVSIPVADQDRALAFYTDVLGFRLLWADDAEATARELRRKAWSSLWTLSGCRMAQPRSSKISMAIVSC